MAILRPERAQIRRERAEFFPRQTGAVGQPARPGPGGRRGRQPKPTFLAGQGVSLQPEGFNAALAAAPGFEGAGLERSGILYEPRLFGLRRKPTDVRSGKLRRRKLSAGGTILSPDEGISFLGRLLG